MDTELILEPPEVVVDESDHHSKAPQDPGSPVPDVVNDVALGASAPMGRRRGRGRDKADAAIALPSFIWDYFVKDASGKFVICTLCPAQTTRFAYSGGTSTMNRHLRKKHQKYAPGKCAADYEYPRGVHRRPVQLQAITSPAATSSANAANGSGLLMSADTAGVLGTLSPSDPLGCKQRHQLIELRTARRRAASGGAAAKRRKVVDQTEQAAAAALTVTGTEFDPSGFVTLPGGSTATATSGALQFPAGFELNDAAIEMAGVGLDQRFFDYSTLTGTSTSTGLRGRRHSSSIGGNSGGNAANSAANQKILTHRLLKYLIAQYEPLDVSHMGTELSMLLFGGSTEWPTPGLNFGYGGFGGAGDLEGGHGRRGSSKSVPE
ncbi:hypothetical protein PC116_g20656 [Phytophthora cactorum]|nr:hypothetical protein PC112_g16584 [Phytophthora cactorum]KAG2834692.1 hypothetical protein PC111_g5729 [Phytophthora cactorum]KAG3003655.1 hypothetical protein PC119_g15886 [Phytophthora cactorum]KAG3010400.1 hypothetical protein PC120_g15072 [Phytophthora cactorum]KAG3073325.1 hypothetical protein PC122_g14855 [Phytophthora cactorum]